MQGRYQAQATCVGGRAGLVVSCDRRLRLELSVPAALGGDDGPGTNPEQLFAAALAASFLSAIKTIAGREACCALADANVTATVGLCTDTAGCPDRLSVRMTVDLPGIASAEAERIVVQARAISPFAKVLRDHVEVAVQVV